MRPKIETLPTRQRPKKHDITQNVSHKGNCMNHETTENFFGRLKFETFYDEKFESVNAFIETKRNESGTVPNPFTNN